MELPEGHEASVKARERRPKDAKAPQDAKAPKDAKASAPQGAKAGSAAAQGTKAGRGDALWKTQGTRDSVVLPSLLLTTVACLAMYQHAAGEEDTTVRNFLLKLLLAMLPLVALEKRLLACARPVELFLALSTKVLLMHTSSLALQTLSGFIVTGDTGVVTPMVFVTLAAAGLLLLTVFGFRPGPACIWGHRDVWCVGVLACLAAAGTELAEVFLSDGLQVWVFWNTSWYRHKYLKLALVTASEYIEILTFAPALWMAFRSGPGAGTGSPDIALARRRAVALFTFMVMYYLSEDVLNACELALDFPPAAAGHVVHFLLVLDFATFVLAHLYDPDKQARLGELAQKKAD